MRYTCYFMLYGAERHVDVDSIEDVKDGFWVHDFGRYATKGSDGQQWVPPSQILHVQKNSHEPRTED